MLKICLADLGNASSTELKKVSVSESSGHPPEPFLCIFILPMESFHLVFTPLPYSEISFA